MYAGVTDLVDGWVARKYNLKTVVGTVIDPMADKALMTVVTVGLAMKAALPGEFDHYIIEISLLPAWPLFFFSIRGNAACV